MAGKEKGKPSKDNKEKKDLVLKVKNLTFFYSKTNEPSVKNINFNVERNKVLALIGPSGCGKSTLLRCFNQIHSLYEGSIYEGEILYNNINIIDRNIDLIQLRTKIGMIFQKPTPFPMNIFDNVAYGLRLQGIKKRNDLFPRVENALRGAGLWDEVKDRLNQDGVSLSGGQQQRLCIARAIILNPDILLFDEPTSALDPISTNIIEELIVELKKTITIIIVTHNMQQAERISDETAFMYLGRLIEIDKTSNMFKNPKEKLTKEYINGKFG